MDHLNGNGEKLPGCPLPKNSQSRAQPGRSQHPSPVSPPCPPAHRGSTPGRLTAPCIPRPAAPSCPSPRGDAAEPQLTHPKFAPRRAPLHKLFFPLRKGSESNPEESRSSNRGKPRKDWSAGSEHRAPLRSRVPPMGAGRGGGETPHRRSPNPARADRRRSPGGALLCAPARERSTGAS